MKTIIGLNAFHADASAVLIKNNKLVYGIEEEKILRIKHWSGFPSNSLNECLIRADLKDNEKLEISINTSVTSNLIAKLKYFLKNYILSHKRNEILNRIKNKLNIKKLIKYNNININYVDHHLSHIASSFYASKFDSSIGISIDGFGDFVSCAIADCKSNKIKIIKKIYFPHSLGIFYEAMTQLLGFANYGDEYKLMGLSSFGKPIYFDKIKKNLFENDKFYKLNLIFFNHNKKNFRYVSEGVPNQNNLFNSLIQKIFLNLNIQDFKTKSNLASSTQYIYEFFLNKIISYALTKIKSKNLCLSGGCALNSLANGKIFHRYNFDNIYVPFAPGDAGGAIGSSCITSLKINKIIPDNISNPFIGDNYDNENIKKAILSKHNETFKIEELDPDLLSEIVAKKIYNSQVIGWFQSKIEFGARALGNRSILANPANKDIKDIINLKIKRRENFRPFAPAIMKEYSNDWFYLNNIKMHYMESVTKVKEDKIKLIPSVVHVDNTARVQIVSSDQNKKFYNLIKNFYKISNIPLLLNTSFNENEPIVRKPEEAINCFLRTDMDCLVIENYLLTKV